MTARPALAVGDAKPIDLWGAWLLAAADSSLMLQAWSVAAPEDRVRAYVGYRAALDREEHAALVLATRLSTWVQGE
jgi:HD superfamily phosphodiesterase